MKTASDGQRGWTDSAFSPFAELQGQRLTQLRYSHTLCVLQHWREVFTTVAMVRFGELEGEKVFVLKLSGEGIPTRTLHVSAKSGLVLKEETTEISPGLGQLPMTSTYTDYRPVQGVMLPFKIESEVLLTGGKVVTEFENATTPGELPGDAFRLTPPPKR